MIDKTDRRTKAAILELRYELAKIVEEHKPLTVRHLFYLAVAKGLIDKTEAEYRNVIMRLAGIMREEWWAQRCDRSAPTGAVVPFGSEHITDAGRWIHKPDSYPGAEQALRNTARFYRRDLWADAPVYVVFLAEKDAIGDIVYQVTEEFDVPLAIMRGHSSKTFLFEQAIEIDRADKETFLYFIGDHDPAGDQIIASAVERVRRYATTRKNIHWQKLAVTPEQISRLGLPLRPTKGAKVDRKFARGSVEVDAIAPAELRRVIRAAIEQHVDKRAMRVLEAAERSERTLMTHIAERLPAIRDWFGDDDLHGQ